MGSPVPLKTGDFNTPSVFHFSKEIGGLKFDVSKSPSISIFQPQNNDF